MAWRSSSGWPKKGWQNKAAAATLADIILDLRGDTTHGVLTNSNHTLDFNNGPEPAFAMIIPVLSKSLGAGDKKYWQTKRAAGTAARTNNNSGAGMLDASFAGQDPAASTHAYFFQDNGAIYHNGNNGAPESGFAAGISAVLNIWDGSRVAYYEYTVAYGYGGGGLGVTNDPVAGTGGLICSGLTLPATPFIATGNYQPDEDIITITGGLQAFDGTLATIIANLRGVGFTALGEP